MPKFPESFLEQRGPYWFDQEVDYALTPYRDQHSSLLERIGNVTENALDGISSGSQPASASGWSAVPVNATGIKGTNYIPDASHEYMHNYQIFLSPPSGNFSSGNIAVELDKLQSMGISHLRVFQNMYGFSVDRDDHITNLTTFANMCSGRDLQIILVMFDGIGAEYSKAEEFWYAPWYELLGQSGNGSGVFDPLSRTNHDLLANSNSRLAKFSGDTHALFKNKSKLPGVGLGDWLSAPGQWWIQTRTDTVNQIVTPNNYPGYPAESGHSGFWRLMEDYIDETLNVFSGELSGTLHSVDLLNEGELSSHIYLTNPSLFDPNSPAYVPDYVTNEFALSMPLSQSHAYDRLANFCAYWTRHIHTEHSGVPVTLGHYEILHGVELLLKINYFGADCLPDYYSFHAYGDGWLMDPMISDMTGNFQSQLSGFSPIGNIGPITEYRDFVLNEFWRTDANTDDSLKWSLHYLNNHGVGGVFWGAFQTQAFNTEVNTDDWLWHTGNAPSYELYPSLGIMGHYPAGTLLERNPTLIEYVSGWCHSGYAPEPVRYFVSGESYINNYSGIGSTNLSVSQYPNGPFHNQVNPERLSWFFTRETVDPNFYFENISGGTLNSNLIQRGIFNPYPGLGPSNKRNRNTVANSKLSGEWTQIDEAYVAKSINIFYYPGGDRRVDGDYFVKTWISNSGVYNPDLYYDQYFTEAHVKAFRAQPPSASFYRENDHPSSSQTSSDTSVLIDNANEDIGADLGSPESSTGLFGGYSPNYTGFTGIIDPLDLRGCNYVCTPSYTGFSNPVKMFLDYTGYGSYNEDAVSGDLQALKDVGIGTIRVFQNPWGYIYDRNQHINNLSGFANLCIDMEMKMILTLFEGVGYDAGILPPYHGWHTIVSDTPTNYWDINSDTNTHLSVLSTSGILAAFDYLQEASYANGSYVDNFKPGFWIGFPGAGYLGTFEHVTGGYGGETTPGYPDSTFVTDGGASRIARHSGFWQVMIDYARDVCDVFTGEYRDALLAVDIINEPEVSVFPDTIYAVRSSAALGEYTGLLPYNPANSLEESLLASALANERSIAFHAYWNDLIRNEYAYPTTLSSLGHGEAFFTYYEMFVTHRSPFDIMSFHDYGPGYVWDPLMATLSSLGRTLFGDIPLCVNECWRQNNGGDKALLFNLWEAQKYGISVINWSILEDNAFGGSLESFTGSYWPFADITGYQRYPDTGIIRRLHYYSGQDHTGSEVLTHVRRPDLTGYLAEYYSGGTISEPLYYTVEGPTFVEPGKSYNYSIVDQHRRPMTKGNERIHWRVYALGDFTNSGFDPRLGGGVKANSVYGIGTTLASSDSPVTTTEGHHLFPSAGSILECLSGSAYDLDSTVFEYQVPYSTETRDILIGGMISHNRNMDPNDFNNLQLETVYPKRIRVKKSYPFLWKKSYYFDENPLEWVGGPIGSDDLKTSDFKVTDDYENSYSAERHYYRKFFLSYVGSETLSGTKVFLENLSHTGHLKIALEKNDGDSAETLTSLPQNFVTTDFEYVTGYDEGLLYGTLTPGDSFGVWVQFNFNDPYMEPDTLIDGSFKISVEGF